MKRLHLLIILFFAVLQISSGNNLFIKGLEGAASIKSTELNNQTFNSRNTGIDTLSHSEISNTKSENGSSSITGFEYWIDGDYNSKAFQSVASNTDFLLNSSIQTHELTTGFHTIDIRFKDNLNRWSSIINSFFIKQPASKSNSSVITTCEYWFDNNDSSKVLRAIPPTNFYKDTLILTGNIPQGMHTIHIRYKDNYGRWSSVISWFFTKQSSSKYTEGKIVAREIWFDNDYSNRIKTTITPSGVYQDTLLPTSNLTAGMHTIHIRYKDNFGRWSSVNSTVFYKKKLSSNPANFIKGYRYWFDTSSYKMVSVNLTISANPYVLNTNIKTQGLGVGLHKINFQFMDATGLWSSVISDTVIINRINSSVTINALENGPAEDLYSIPENGTGYVYFSMLNVAGQPVADSNSFVIKLNDQNNQEYKDTALMISPGVLQIAIPGSQFTTSYGISDTLTIQDSISLGDTLYRLSSPAPPFHIEKAEQDYTRTFDFFAEGSAGVSASVGVASIDLAKVSITGTAGAGLTISVDPDNNLTLGRRLQYGVTTGLEIPSVNFFGAQPVAGISADVSAKTMIGQEITTTGLTGLSTDQVTMAQAGFVLETLSMGTGNFSPTLGVLLLATQQTLTAESGVSQILTQSLVKNSNGLDLEGNFTAGFSANCGAFKLNIGNTSFSGELSGRENLYPKGMPGMAHVTSSNSFTQTFDFDLSLLSFSFESGNGASAKDSDLSFFDVGTGMETGAEAFFDNNQQLQQLDLWVEGGGDLAINSSSPKNFIKTELDIPGEYQNILTQNSFAINGLFSKNNLITFKNIAHDFPAIVNTVTDNFIQTPITIKTYENSGQGTNLFLGADIDGAVGVGLGLKLGVDLQYYDEVSYLQKQALLYGNNNIYLMSSSHYSAQMDSYQLSTFFNTIVSGTASMVQTAFLNLMTSLKKVVASGENFVMNGINKTGTLVGSVAGNIGKKAGEIVVSIFSPTYRHLWKESFAEPVVQNLYYSTKVQHKVTSNNKAALVNVNTTMVAVSDNMKVSFIPDGHTVSVDSVDSTFTIKMLIDTALLRENSFSLTDSSRIKIYRYNDSNGSWILVGGTLHGDTLEASTKYMENYLLGIELTDADDQTAPTIVDYGPKPDSTLTTYQRIYAKIQDNQYGVGVNWNKTFLIANRDTLNASFDPTNQEIFYDLSENDSLSSNIDIKVFTSDYNGNSDSINFSIHLTITGVNQQSMTNGFQVSQNYPNPFSSVTKINYSIPKSSKVKVMIFNSTGGYIATLNLGYQAPGSYSINFNREGLPSGIYFYSFVAAPIDGSGVFRVTKKMSVVVEGR